MATELLSEVRGDPDVEIAHDVECVRTGIVNCFLYGEPGAGDRGWVLVDAGMYGFGHTIVRHAARRFGAESRPAAIVMTHGHFDHIGALRELAEAWDAPVYAHRLELPYLTGRSSYPPPDPTVGGGFMALGSPLYPRGPIDLGERVQPLPEDGSVPGMPGWRWLWTPGHTPGHVSLFRDSDAVLIAGDAFVTTKQESLLAVLEQRPEIHGPPAYFTQDWDAARGSVQRLAELKPEVVATGHGRPLRGRVMREGLEMLAANFEMLAVPRDGRYVRAPALADERGTVSVPPAVFNPTPVLIGAGAALALGILLGRRLRQRD
ncbi:MBL fold metallo-hydrolase [Longimicrobium sp.]|uniref:MBL fold metallo-hydrolase n=1 Tax=Longimicrobium sp. TaxID=2029185 RepID=UPI002C37B3FC|nr:MBL fold metallo-hydrolase [Longimicrobium sp.]HSU15586.1 MBL fold metallo-hydrolase [Longimicrobium sp.]